jgi:cytochrome c oxidase subunit 2
MLHFVIVAVLVALSTFGLGTYFASGALLPDAASQQSVIIDWLFGVHGWLVAFFFSLIVVFLLYSVIVFRRRPGEQGDGVYLTGNHQLEIIWTVIPLALVLWLAVIGARTLADVERRDPDAMVVEVFAAQWSWSFQYENGAITTDLVLPVDRQVLLRLHSNDVIHSFYVPEFRVKQDVLPGGPEFTRELRITPTKQGAFKIQCAEICGQLHYDMLADVLVVSEGEFLTWLDQAGGECEGSDELCGERWAQQAGCLSCHSLDGTVVLGPSWLGLAGSEEELADGSTVIVDADYLKRSILEPDAQIVAGFNPGIMPRDFGVRLTEVQIDQIVAFILSLGEE